MGLAHNEGNQEEVLLEQALQEIGRKYRVYFSYDRTLIDNVKVELSIDSYESVDDALTSVMGQTNLFYQIFDQRYVAVYQNTKEGLESLKKMVQHFQKIIDTQEMVNKRRVNLLSPIATFSAKELYDKRIVVNVSGRVTSSAGEPLIGVNVLVKGTDIGTATDFDGKFVLNDVDENAVLVLSYIGYQTLEVPVAGKSNVSVTLFEDSQTLDEVVVVGYGTQKKSDLTGAVSSLKNEDFNQGMVNSPQDLIAGKISGVQIVQNSPEPGGGFSVSIRGVSSINAGTEPLYVIDGMPIDNSPVVSGGASGNGSRNPLSSLNPNDIESIEVLKDASATAIYGARGANGVILITTKSGKSGDLKVNYDYYLGIQSITKKLDILSPNEYQTVLNDLLDAGAINATGTERVTDLVDGGTNWQDHIFRNAKVSSHNLSISGGNSATKYFLGINYFDQEGILKKTSFKRYGLRLNLDHKVNQRLLFGAKINTILHHDEYVPGGVGGNDGGVLYSAYNYDPSGSIYDDNLEYYRSNFMAPIDHPIALMNGRKNEANAYRTFGTLFGEYEFLPDLKFRLNVGGDTYQQKREGYTDRSTLTGAANGGSAYINNGQNANYLIEGLFQYSASIGDGHQIDAILGSTFQRFIETNNSLTGRNFPLDVNIIEAYAIGSGDALQNTIGSSQVSNSLLSYLSRVNYGLLNRYLFTLSYRIDGSSRFGENNRFGHFPSAAIAWRIDQEPFFDSLERSLSSLKMRTSWGRTGNEQIGNYQSITTFGSGGIAVLDNNPISTLVPNRIGNPNLKWETTEQINIGLDFGILNDRIFGSIDWFKKSTFDMLLNLPIPTSTGFGTQTQNVGGMENNGLEFGITSRNIVNTITWETSVSLTSIKNKVTNLSNLDQIISGSAGFANQFSLIQVDLPVRSFYGYEILGVWQTNDDFSVTDDNVQPGDFKYKDTNQDGVVNSEDRVVLGNSFPKLMWSIGNTLTFKGLELYLFFEGQEGLKMYNGNASEAYFPIDFRRNKYAEPMLNRWTEQNPTNEYPSFLNPLGQGEKYVNSRTVEDASYIRLNTIRLSYNFNLNRFIEHATVYITGQNLATWSEYSGIDPAVNSGANKTLRIDYNAYPLTKIITGGVVVNF
ncbi:TonB-dependent receptor [Membranihabitans marinus]